MLDDDPRSLGLPDIDGLVTAEIGDSLAEVMRRHRVAEETRFRASHPEEGLRERKRRHTRQLISEVATTLVIARGFDAVRVSEIADRAGVSEKTVYNYFPSKEAMVLDGADDLVETITTALRERAPGTSITEAVVAALEDNLREFQDATGEMAEFVPRFVRMVEGTPALHAHWLELHDRLAGVAAQELAAEAGIDPQDPEAAVAGRALVGLVQVTMDCQMRHIKAGLTGPGLGEAVTRDIRRAARLLDTGLWSFNLAPTERARTQAREAIQAAEEARRQVMSALRDARTAWEAAQRERRRRG